MTGVVKIILPQLNTAVLSEMAEVCLTENPLRKAQGKPGTLEHHVSVLEHFRGTKDVDHMVHVGVLLGFDERTLPEVIECLSLPHLIKETTSRGFLVAIVTGSLMEWKAAFKRAEVTVLTAATKDILNRIVYELQLEKRFLLK